MKIRTVGAEFCHAESQTDGRTKGLRDRQTDMTRLTDSLFAILRMHLKKGRKIDLPEGHGIIP
jgi:hypothetical protein